MVLPLTLYAKTIAIVDFLGFNVSQTDAYSFSDIIRARLLERSDIKILSKAEVYGAISSIEMPQGTDITAIENIIALGNKLGADMVITGTVSHFRKLGEYIYVSANLVDIESGRFFLSEDTECRTIQDFPEKANIISDKIISIIDRDNIARPMDSSARAFDFSSYLSRKKEFNRFGVSAGYPYVGAWFGIFPSLSAEARAAFSTEATAFGARLNFSVKEWDRIGIYAGVESYYYTFSAFELEGSGWMASPLLGIAFSATEKLRFSMDIGPLFIYIKENEKLYSQYYFGDIIMNLGLIYFL